MPRQQYECKRCGHKWFSRKNPPTVCAKCHNVYWNKDRIVERGIASVGHKA